MPSPPVITGYCDGRSWYTALPFRLHSVHSVSTVGAPSRPLLVGSQARTMDRVVSQRTFDGGPLVLGLRQKENLGPDLSALLLPVYVDFMNVKKMDGDRERSGRS